MRIIQTKEKTMARKKKIKVEDLKNVLNDMAHDPMTPQRDRISAIKVLLANDTETNEESHSDFANKLAEALEK